MAGALLYFFTSFVFFVVDSFTGDGFIGAQFWGFTFVLVVFLAIGLRNALLGILLSRDAPRSWVYEEWKDTRRWLWVVVVAVPIAGTLFGYAIFRWGREWFLASSLVWQASLGAGLLLQMAVRHLIESNTEPGT